MVFSSRCSAGKEICVKMKDTKADIKSMDLEELKREMGAAGEKAFRAKQRSDERRVGKECRL